MLLRHLKALVSRGPQPSLLFRNQCLSHLGQERLLILNHLGKLPPDEKTLDRLGDEAATTVAAGTLTTAWTLSIAMYYLLTMPELLQKLKTELAAAIPDPSTNAPLATIENLPYLTAVVQEAIRLGYGGSGRVCALPVARFPFKWEPIQPKLSRHVL